MLVTPWDCFRYIAWSGLALAIVICGASWFFWVLESIRQDTRAKLEKALEEARAAKWALRDAELRAAGIVKASE
jgi:hypothetical protein